ncbi:c-type cytochrome [Sneathiella limimaris]|uniref:c-type cytochrome n=1 Tax=Sneathiella limimaris TaxID=1964213 RepID=UPI00146F1056|nr:cytochrome c [Sneathiella limimaris]
MKIKTLKYAAAVMVLGTIGVTAVSAHSMSTGNADADKRITMMKELGMHMKKIAAVAKGEAKYSAALKKDAAGISEISAAMPDLFPEGSGGEKTRSKPEIWSDAAGFDKAVKDFQMAAAGLVAAVESGDQGQIGAALGATGKTCGGCHKPYRKPEH